jgi:two-component system nitrate/nitrite sensor histidine kinase NarX
MVAGSRSVGTLIVGREDAAFSKDEIAVAGTAADLLAAAVQNAQLHDVEKQQAASGERQRLARDLHDAVTQSIYSASLISAALPDMWERSPEEGMKNLQALRRLVRAALAELRSLLYELRPASLEAAPLDVLLERLADSLKGRSEARLEIRVPSDLLLPPEVKLAFYRVAQEAINNVGKHSRSTVANVTVDTGDNGLRLVVSDDGWGFDPARRRRVTDASGDAFGIGIMQSRAEEIGATLEIDSIPGLGTTVEMIWHQPDAEDASQQWGDGPHG